MEKKDEGKRKIIKEMEARSRWERGESSSIMQGGEVVGVVRSCKGEGRGG